MACKVVHLEKLRPKSTPISSPYNLINLIINGSTIHGRPIAWDSAITDHHNLLNEHGGPIIPTRVITLCPDCRQTIEWEITTGVLEFNCPHCRPPLPPPVIVPLEDPFRNPFLSGLIDFETINLDLISMLGEIPNDTVASRVANEFSDEKTDLL